MNEPVDTGPYAEGLDRNRANYTPLSPLMPLIMALKPLMVS